jgi:hypothetical protein
MRPRVDPEASMGTNAQASTPDAMDHAQGGLLNLEELPSYTESHFPTATHSHHKVVCWLK